MERSHEPSRRSDRLAGKPALDMNEYALREPTLKSLMRRPSARSGQRRAPREWRSAEGAMFVSSRKEVYTREHYDSLGHCKTKYPWQQVLIPKIYDQNGTTCHQCRQKTRDKKTLCTQCGAISSQFCGMCLQLRYGENLDEVFETVKNGGQWLCPLCRGICLFSFLLLFSISMQQCHH